MDTKRTEDLLPPLPVLRERLADNLEEHAVLRGLLRLAERREATRSTRRHLAELQQRPAAPA